MGLSPRCTARSAPADHSVVPGPGQRACACWAEPVAGAPTRHAALAQRRWRPGSSHRHSDKAPASRLPPSACSCRYCPDSLRPTVEPGKGKENLSFKITETCWHSRTFSWTCSEWTQSSMIYGGVVWSVWCGVCHTCRAGTLTQLDTYGLLVSSNVTNARSWCLLLWPLSAPARRVAQWWRRTQ